MLTLSSLEYIDLSRNQIGEIMPGTFLGMGNLKGLDFSVNNVRKVGTFFLEYSTNVVNFTLNSPLYTD